MRPLVVTTGLAAVCRRSRLPGGAVLVICLCTWLGGCSTYSWKAQTIRPLVQRGNYKSALENLEPLREGGSRLLYLYERGLIMHYENRFAESNAELDSAELLLDDLYTRSLSREVGALLTSDNLVEYRGERFEAAFAHYYKTLNYLHLGETEEAAVECRRLNLRLRGYRDDPSGFYVDDPFLQYLTGLVYQEVGEDVDANVSFRLAAAAYDSLQASYGVERPAHFFCDLQRNAVRLGDTVEATSYARAGNCSTAAGMERGAPPAASKGTVHLFLECGYVPYKEQVELVLPILKDEITDDLDRDAYCLRLVERRHWSAAHRSKVKLEYLLRVAVPEIAITASGIESARVVAHRGSETVDASSVVASNETSASSVVASNLSLFATRAFEAKQGTIWLRTVTRGFLKYLASRQAEKKSGELAGLLVNALGVITESADTRSWSTLPEKILVVQLELPAGIHDLEVTLVERNGEREPFVIRNVTVRAGHATFLNHRVF